jgi:hypothetical protein
MDPPIIYLSIAGMLLQAIVLHVGRPGNVHLFRSNVLQASAPGGASEQRALWSVNFDIVVFAALLEFLLSRVIHANYRRDIFLLKLR